MNFLYLIFLFIHSSYLKFKINDLGKQFYSVTEVIFSIKNQTNPIGKVLKLKENKNYQFIYQELCPPPPHQSDDQI